MPKAGVPGYSRAMRAQRGKSEHRHALPNLLPRPRRIRPGMGHFDLTAPMDLYLDPEDRPGNQATLLRLQTGIEAAGIGRPRTTSSPARLGPGGKRARIELVIDLELDESDPTVSVSASGRRRKRRARHDAYQLSVTFERVEIRAGNPAGLRYGVETLLQLIESRGRIPCCRIQDSADLELRGLMLDISRGKVPTRESLEELIDTCVALKLNVLMLYTEHTFRFKKHPAIGRNASPLNARTLTALDAYAAERFVDLVPCLQSLGHMEHILKLPAYQAMAETESGWTIAPSHPRSLPFLKDLYDEYLPLFRSNWFNANCDEPWDLGRGLSAKRSQALGAGGLYLEHVHKIQRLARRHGKRMMIWGDVVHAHPHRVKEIDPNLVLLDWWYESNFDFDRVKIFARHNIDFLVCSGTSSWNSLFPRIANSLENISGWADAGRKHGALGLLNTDWGDHGHYNLQGNSLMAYAWGAQEAWSGPAPPKDFDRAFSRLFFDDPKGEVARIYRSLGSIHNPGFKVFNGSPLQYLFFDSVESAYFIGACRASQLTALERRLDRLGERIQVARQRGIPGRRHLDEILYASDASAFAVRKAAAGLEYLTWRKDPSAQGARGRKLLARTLQGLAEEQIALGRRLRKLWLLRAQESNLDQTLKRLRRSARHMRAAAKRLETNRPSPEPERKKISIQGVLQSLRESLS